MLPQLKSQVIIQPENFKPGIKYYLILVFYENNMVLNYTTNVEEWEADIKALIKEAIKFLPFCAEIPIIEVSISLPKS